MFARLFAALSACLLTALLSASPASAQHNPNDLGGILEDIFGPGRYPAPAPQFPGTSQIENIPVEVQFDIQNQALSEDAMLVVTAFAPPPPNVRRAYPLMLGETQILLRGLSSPLQIVIATPGQNTHNSDYVRVEARIEDHNGTPLFKSENSGEYRGHDPVIMTLRNSQTPAPGPRQGGTIISQETVSGRVTVDDPSQIFRGASLVVRLVEENLAGGHNLMIVGDTKVSLDNKSAPYDFKLERTVNTQSASAPLAFEAWIEDWAGRKTHVLPSPVSFAGAQLNYELKLVPGAAVNQALPAPVTRPAPTPAAPIATIIEGEARFNAFKGLPAGSVLIAELERMDVSARPATIAVQRIKLDGLSGYIPFKLSATQDDLIGNGRVPVLRIRIEDANGKLFFSNPGGTPVGQGFNAVELRASPNY